MAAMSDTTKQILEYASITHLKCRIGRLNRCEIKKKIFMEQRRPMGVLIGQKSIFHCAGNPEFILSKKYTALSIGLPAQ